MNDLTTTNNILRRAEEERPSMCCMICGLRAYARDPEMVKYGKSHYDCESGGHSFYPNAVQQCAL